MQILTSRGELRDLRFNVWRLSARLEMPPVKSGAGLLSLLEKENGERDSLVTKGRGNIITTVNPTQTNVNDNSTKATYCELWCPSRGNGN